MNSNKPTSRWALLLLAAASTTLLLKFGAYYLSHSVGMFSDAAESFVNLSTASLAFFALSYATRPADQHHAYGHEKIEFFASGLEGAFIIVAAIWIITEAVSRFFNPQPITAIPESIVIAIVAAVINGGVAFWLRKPARKYDSIVLTASSKHLMVDVWTTAGVVVGLLLVVWTDTTWLDPLIALLIGAHVVWSGFDLLRRSYQGLMDRALPEEEIVKIKQIINVQLSGAGKFHALRTRRSGARRFLDFHLLVEGASSLTQVHHTTLEIENALAEVFPEMDVTIHMEPIEEPSSWQDASPSRRL